MPAQSIELQILLAKQKQEREDLIETEGIRVELANLKEATNLFPRRHHNWQPRRLIEDYIKKTRALILRAQKVKQPELITALLALETYFFDARKYSRDYWGSQSSRSGTNQLTPRHTSDGLGSASGLGSPTNFVSPHESIRQEHVNTSGSGTPSGDEPASNDQNSIGKKVGADTELELETSSSPVVDSLASVELGHRGELFCLKMETERLRNRKISDPSFPIHVSKTIGDHFGCDITSLAEDLSFKYIEVKTTTGPFETKFYMSANEMRFLKQNPERYEIHRVFKFDVESGSGQIRIISGLELIEEMYEIKPDSFLMVPTI